MVFVGGKIAAVDGLVVVLDDVDVVLLMLF